MNIDMSAGFEGLQRPAVGADKLDRPDICGFDANASNNGILGGQFRPFPTSFDRQRAARWPIAFRSTAHCEFFNDIKLEGGNGGQFGSLMGG